MGSRGSSSGKASASGAGSGAGGSKHLTIKQMIDQGMSPEQIRQYRLQNGLYTPYIRKIEGVRGSVADTWEAVQSSSPNEIFASGSATLSNDRGTVRVRGDKKDRFGVLNGVNTAVVHLDGVSGSPTKREVAKINKQLKQIRDMGFDTPLIATNKSGETIVYAKRQRFTKNF